MKIPEPQKTKKLLKRYECLGISSDAWIVPISLVLVIGYGLVMTIIIVPLGDTTCLSKFEKNRVQNNFTLGNWEMQFISERFCQCYESEQSWKQVLPFVSVACLLGVIVVVFWLDHAYTRRIEKQSISLCGISWEIPRVFKEILVVLNMTFYTILIIFTHRPVEGFRPYVHYVSDGFIHFFSTTAFFMAFTALYACAVWDHARIPKPENQNSKYIYPLQRSTTQVGHVVILFLLLIFSLLFSWFGLIQRGNIAILFEYILFFILVLVCLIWALMIVREWRNIAWFNQYNPIQSEPTTEKIQVRLIPPILYMQPTKK